jgi:hypothetical protein
VLLQVLDDGRLTDGQGRALSGHKSKAYEGYAKRTEKRALAGTRKRYAHRVAALAEDDGVEGAATSRSGAQAAQP